ncbi:MAG TPA: hypothetical protein VKV04_14360, partial [Verrucomicrobiae bacterium]|nr:hypothetical protein [Verrucomicrobiae bacterium]
MFCRGLNSLKVALSNGSVVTLSSGDSVSGYNSGAFYAETAEPELRTVDYYFGRPSTSPGRGYSYAGDPLPGSLDGSFDVTNTTPSLMLGTAGIPMIIAGYAKQAILNGVTNSFAYVG